MDDEIVLHEPNSTEVLIFNIATVIGLGALVSHVLRCEADGDYVFMIGGIFVSPIGVINGIGILMGVW